jgi:DNA-binding transcriptional LysR family regulator
MNGHHQRHRAWVREAVRRIEADFQRSADTLEAVVLSAHPACVVCRAGHPLRVSRAPRPQDLFRDPLAGPRLPPGVAQVLAGIAPPEQRAALLREGPLTIECDSSSVLKAILLHSDVLSMMPRFMAQAEVVSGLLDVIPMPGLGLQPTLAAAWLRRRSMSGAGRKFAELLQAHDAALAAGGEGAQAKGRRARKQAPRRGARRPRAVHLGATWATLHRSCWPHSPSW